MSTEATEQPTARDREEGSASIFIAALGLALLMATGLAVDGGRKLGALSEARNVADNAARAGAQMVDANAYRATGDPAIDPGAATAAANGYLGRHGYQGTVSVSGATVTVTVSLSVPTRFLPGPMSVSATESATAVAGI